MSSNVATDTPYTWGYYNELSPLYLNYICTLNGHRPVPLEESFTYCELGCGFGVTTNGLAELFPQGDFVGIDFNDGHIAAATQMAEEIGIANVAFKAVDFNALAQAALPQFDFIVLHGVYSWVEPETRENILKFIAANLRADGVVYVSYDALPGWSALAPLRDIVLTHTADMATDNLVKAQAGLDYLDFMANNNAAYFVDNPPVKKFLAEIKSKEISYVAHEFLVDFSQPFYFHQVAAEMQAIGLNYSGSAFEHMNFIDLAVPAEFSDILAKAKTRTEFESRGDFIRNQRFRKDIFKNSRETMGAEEQLETLSHIVFGTTCAASEFQTAVAFGDVALNYSGEVFQGLIEVLSDSPNSAANLAALAQFKAYPLDLIIDALKFLSAGGQLIPLRAAAQGRTALDLTAERYTIPAKFNIQYLKHRLLQQEALVLIAPRAGIGIEMPMADALFTLCLVEAPRDGVAEWAFQRLIEAKQEVVFVGGTQLEAINQALEKFRQTRLPKFLELGILEPAE